jgi:hypothetical protein
MGKTVGVVSKVHFIGVRPGIDTRKVWQASITRGINGIDGFLERIQVSIFLGLNPPLDFLLYSRCHQPSVRRMKWRTEQTRRGHSAAQDGARWGRAVGDDGCDRLGEHEEQGRGVDHMGQNGPTGRSAVAAGPRRLSAQRQKRERKFFHN